MRWLAVMVLALAPGLLGQEVDIFDPDLERPKMVRVQFEYIEVSQEDYLELMAVPRNGADATPARKRLQEMVAKDEAKVVETGMVVCRSGERATAESIGERIYESEYEPSVFPGSQPIPEILDYRWLRMGIFSLGHHAPVYFETRNTGHTIEVAPNIGHDSQMIDLHMAPELVKRVGESVHFEDHDFGGQVHRVRYPLFSKHAVGTALTCWDGQYHLMSTVTPTGEDGELDSSRKLMVFVKCDVIVVKEIEK